MQRLLAGKVDAVHLGKCAVVQTANGFCLQFLRVTFYTLLLPHIPISRGTPTLIAKLKTHDGGPGPESFMAGFLF